MYTDTLNYNYSDLIILTQSKKGLYCVIYWTPVTLSIIINTYIYYTKLQCMTSGTLFHMPCVILKLQQIFPYYMFTQRVLHSWSYLLNEIKSLSINVIPNIKCMSF